MDFIKKINDVFSSNLLVKDLIFIPSRGAFVSEIKEEENFISRPLSLQYKNFLQKWNGLNLDVIRFYGCGLVEDSLETLRDNQKILPPTIPEGVIIGSDPSGFCYIEDEEGKIFLLDTDGGEILKISSSLEDLICNYVFGGRANDFGGTEWREELKANRLIK